jgi:hypothetical protein
MPDDRRLSRASSAFRLAADASFLGDKVNLAACRLRWASVQHEDAACEP